MTSIVHAVGCDPGKTGGFSLLTKEGPVTYVNDVFLMPLSKDKSIDCEKIVDKLLEWKNQYGSFNLTLEKQHALTGQGITSIYNTGLGFGYLVGISSALFIPYKIVRAREWQKVYPDPIIPEDILKLNIKDTKKKSLSVCKKLFPSVCLTTKRGKYLDCISDSILIANFTLNY